MWLRRVASALFLACAIARAASGIILLNYDDTIVNQVNVTTPGDNSGWQYEGFFNGFCGTPIAPLYFVTAKHINGNIGDTFTFHGEAFTTQAAYPDPSTDLQIWKVDHAFACYAPLFTPQTGKTNVEIGQELRVFGHGTQRGAENVLDGTLRGWDWGGGDDVQRWGSNIVADVITPPGYWAFLQVDFDSPGLPNEAHLSVGDSGGGVFILENGLWRLAGINYAVDDLFSLTKDANGNPVYSYFTAAIFDARGYYAQNADGSYSEITGTGNVPTSFYSTQISPRTTWIGQTTGIDPAGLPTESFSDWQHAYFTPNQIVTTTYSGRTADPDGDGIPNLLEFAFNLDPTFTEPAVMVAGTGLRGLPLIRLEQVAASDNRLTVEFVRRTSSSGSGVTYAVQFTSNLSAPADWQPGGTESVTPINARWERVKVTDTVSAGTAHPARFARVAVIPTASAAVAAHLSPRTRYRRKSSRGGESTTP